MTRKLAGQRFGRLLVVRHTDERNKYKQIMWECICDCGKHKLVSTSHLTTGNTKSCGCLWKERHREAVRLPVGEAAFRRLYRSYRRNSEQQKREFDLDPTNFRQLTSSDCFYCGSGLTNLLSEKPFNGDYPYNGLDRTDTNKGYTPDNVVPCCKHCNIAKRAMSQKDFAQLIIEIYNHWAKDFVHE
jgi:hypothetical protein